MGSKNANICPENVLNMIETEATIQKKLFSLCDDSIEETYSYILDNFAADEFADLLIANNLLLTARLRSKSVKHLVNLTEKLMANYSKLKTSLLEQAFAFDSVFITFYANKGNLLFIAALIDSNFFTPNEVLDFIRVYPEFSEEAIPHTVLLFTIFAPEISQDEILLEKFKRAYDFLLERDLYQMIFAQFNSRYASLEQNNFAGIREARRNGYITDTLDEYLDKDNVRKLSNEMQRNPNLLSDTYSVSIYAAAPILSNHPILVWYAAFLGANNCCMKLMDLCEINNVNIDGYGLIHHAIAGGNSVIFDKICDKVNLDGALHTAIEYHQNDIAYYLINQKKQKTNVLHKKMNTPFNTTLSSNNLEFFKYFVKESFNANSKDKSQNAPLHVAAGNGSLSIVRYLSMYPNINMNIKNRSEENPYQVAVIRSRISVVKFLINDNRVDVNQKDKRNTAAIHVASVNGEYYILKEMLLCERVDVNLGNRIGYTPLMLLIENNHVFIAHELINSKRIKLSHKASTGMNSLILATEKNQRTIIEALLEKGVDINIKTKKNKNSLHTAVERGLIKLVELFITRGIDINAQNSDGLNALHYAAEAANVVIFQMLLKAGCNINTKTTAGETPLHFSLQFKTDKIALVLLEIDGIDIKSSTELKWTPLHFAANKNFEQVVEKLLSMSKDEVNSRTDLNKTPLHLACQVGATKIIKMLVENGADPQVIDIEERTPFHFVCENGHIDAAKYLIDLGVNVNAKAFELLTPLHFAAKYNRDSMVEFLLQIPSVDPNCKTEMDETPYMLALQNRAEEVVQVLSADPRVIK